jgi:hypothetical protein
MTKSINPAQIFLKDYLELKVLEKDTDKWTIDKLKSNPPRYFRLKRILSCMSALGIKFDNWIDFEKGYFHNNQKIKLEAEKILKFMSQLLRDKTCQFSISSDKFEIDNAYYFYMALTLRRTIYQFNTLRDTVISTSENYILPLLVIDDMLKDLKTYTKTFDRLLIDFLNPRKITIAKKEMIEKFEFPNIDLDEIDLDWI